MTVQEMALRNEVRQIMNEGGINKNTVKEIVKEEIDMIIRDQVRQALAETDKNFNERVEDAIKSVVSDERKVNTILREEIAKRVRDRFSGMTVTVDVRGSIF